MYWGVTGLDAAVGLGGAEELCRELRAVEETHAGRLIGNPEELAEFESAYRTLRRLERTWTDVIRYGDPEAF